MFSYISVDAQNSCLAGQTYCLQWTVIPNYPYPLQLFPEPALMLHLVDLYFANFNIYMPVLHRPLFEKGINEGLHLSDEGFGGVVLLVCALGAKFSDDPRALLEAANTTHSAGWKWFVQVRRLRRLIFGAPRLYDLQMSAVRPILHSFCSLLMNFSSQLSLLFMYGCSPPQACWIMAGVTIRQAQDVGAHRKKAYASTRNVTDEMWKRAFW